MAYKIKSMLKQTSGTGLGVNYYLQKDLDLNKFLNGNLNDMNPIKNGESIAKGTKKRTTAELIKARERDEKRQIRRAGREAAKNAEVDFVKATPMGSDYFSLMAATAENIASRAGQKRKARKAAEEEYKEFQKEGSSNFDGKGLKKGFKGTDLPKIESDVKRGDFFNNTFNTFNPEKDKQKAQKKSENISESIKDDINEKFIERITTFPQPLTNGKEKPKNKMNTEFIGRITDYPKGGSSDNKNTKILDRQYYYGDGTPRYRVGINPNTGEEYIQINPSPASRAVGETITGISKSIKDAFAAPFSDEAAAARKDRLEQEKQKNQQRQEEAKLDLEKIKKIQGLPMMGDGFNKGMSRKNKYKK